MGRQSDRASGGSGPGRNSRSGTQPQGPAAASAKSATRPGVRRTSPAVYRRRRLVAGGGLLVVLALIFGGFVAAGAFNGPSAAESSPQNNPVPGGETPAPPTEPTPSAPVAPACDQSLVSVAASTDKQSYGPEENPLLTLKVTNGGKVACEVNLGTSQMEYLITSGADRIFSSRDCQAKSEDLKKTIEPGKSETANFPWQRNRSVAGCKVVQAVPGAGGASYSFTATLGDRVSNKVVFALN